jgi:CBS domain-containing protein
MNSSNSFLDHSSLDNSFLDKGVIQQILDLEFGVSVAAIATFNIKTCGINDGVSEVWKNPDFQRFDYIPVSDRGQIVGLLHRHKEKPSLDQEAIVRDNMELLSESILISAEASLLSYLEVADTSPCCLVLQGRKITGIVTISDLQKLPVRPVLFALVTTVELLLAEWLRHHCDSDQDWINSLKENRRQKIETQWNKLQQGNLAIDRITAAEFCDKRDACLKLGAFPQHKNQIKDQLERIEKLRNSVAHAGDYAITLENAQKVSETIRFALKLIKQLQASLHHNPIAPPTITSQTP